MVDKLINIALAEVGYLEKRSNASLDSKTANAGDKNYTKYARDMMKYNAGIFANGYAWCDTFVDWCFTKAFGAEQAEKMLFGWSAYTPTSSGYFKQKKQWHTSNPKKGDVIFFKNASGTICHTGIVYKVDASYVYTVEGNTSSASGVVANGGAVEKKKYALTYNRIAGYGRPVYPKAVQKLERGNDIIWELMNGKYKVKIDDVNGAVKALDKAKEHPEFMRLYWILYKVVNGND
jgi:hypothetical protein